MGFDTWRVGNLTIRPKGVVKLPSAPDDFGGDIDKGANFPGYVVYHTHGYGDSHIAEHLIEPAADLFTFEGWSRWYDDDFNGVLDRWLVGCRELGIEVYGSVECECEEGSHDEWRLDVDNRPSPIRFDHVNSSVVFDDDVMRKRDALLLAALQEWTEWASDDQEVSGADAVDWINGFFTQVRELTPATPMQGDAQQGGPT